MLAALALALAPALAAQGPLITEFAASNQSFRDEDGESSDWIEIHNAAAEAVNLQGWHLTDRVADPEQWTFPDTPLGAGQFLVVFASGKDRRTPGRELHTNFRLAGDGEYLALTRPDLSVATHFAPSYPPQGPGIAYGTGITVQTSSTLVEEGRVVRYRAPADGSLGETWTQASFDSSAWAAGPSPLGFGSLRTYADLVRDDAPLYYWNFDEPGGPALNLMNPAAAQDALTPQGAATRVEHDTLPLGRAASFTGTDGQRFHAGNLSAGTDLTGPWAVEFWLRQLSPTKATYLLEGGTTSGQLNTPGLIQGFNGARLEVFGIGGRTGADGPLLSAAGWHHVVFGYFGSRANEGVADRHDIYVDGVRVSSQAGDFASANRFGGGGLAVGGTLYGSGLNALRGQMDELAVHDLRSAGTAEEVSARLAALAQGRHQAAATGNFGTTSATDVSGILSGRSSSLQVRHEFTVPEAGGLNRLTLRVRYEDGFAAWLNGVRVAGANAPEPVTHDAAALANRPDLDSARFSEIDLSPFASLLTTGANVLAIQGLNDAPSDPRFLISAELVAGVAQSETGYLTTPTPGHPNGTVTRTPGPAVDVVTENPPRPAVGQDLVITARVAPALAAVTEVRLAWRVLQAAAQTAAMRDDGLAADAVAGDGTFSAAISGTAFTAGQMIRWAVTATDADGRTTRRPAHLAPLTSPEYYGTVARTTVTSKLPILEWFLAPGTEAASKTAAGARAAVFFDGVFYDNIWVHLRGASSAGLDKNPFQFEFNPGHPFRYGPSPDQRVGQFQLNTTYRDKAYVRPVLGYGLMRDAGVPYSVCHPLHVRRNNQFFSVALFVEQPDREFLRRNGLDPNGAFYKGNLNGFTLTAQGGYRPVETGFEKKNPNDNDHSDIIAFTHGLAQTGDAATRFVFDAVDLPAQINYMAASVIVQDADRVVNNYYVHRDTHGTEEWRMLPYDLDLSLGQMNLSVDEIKTSTDYLPSHPFYGSRVAAGGGGLWNRLIDVITTTPVLREMYVRRLRTLMDDFLKPAGTAPADLYFEPRIDHFKSLLAADVALDRARWASWGASQTLDQALNLIRNSYLPGRRTHLFTNHSTSTTYPNRAGIPAAQEGRPLLEFGPVEASPVSQNQDEEYLVLVNPQPVSMDISGWSLGGAVSHLFRPGTVIPAAGRIHVAKNVRAFRARTTSPRGQEGLLVQGNYAGQLTARGGTLELRDRAGDLLASATFAGDASEVQRWLRPTEIMAHPEGSGDEEFLEFRNTGPAALDLAGVRLTGGVEFSFSGSRVASLAPGAHVLVVRSEAAFAARYGARPEVAGVFSGRLDNAGGRLRLLDAAGDEVLAFGHEPEWHAITDGHGFSLVAVDEAAAPEDWQTPSQWRRSSAGHGSPGAADPAPAAVAPVVINEVLANPAPPGLDAIEIHNPSPAAADISGWFLTDDFQTAKKFRIPDGTLLPAGGHLVFTAADFDAGGAGFALGSDGDETYLFSADAAGRLTGHGHGFRFGPSEPGVAWGRHVTSIGAEFLVPQSRSTPGGANSAAPAGPVIISEVQYHPARPAVANPTAPPGWLALQPPVDKLEFIELMNITSQPAPLFDPARPANTWRLRGDADLDFPPGITMPSGGTVLLVNFNPSEDAGALATFRGAWSPPADVPIFGPYAPSLGDAGARLELQKPGRPGADGLPRILVDAVTFGPAAPWPAAAAGGGSSLQRHPADSYGNDPLAWAALSPTAGQPVPLPTITAITRDGGVLTVSFSTQRGLRYRVEFSDDLLSWSPLGGPLTGTGAAMSATDLVAAGRRYYRVTQAP